MGTKRDTQRRIKLQRLDIASRREAVEQARKKIFKKGRAVNSTSVKNLLDAESLTPARSPFSELLEKLNMSFYSLLAPDLLHELELGFWRALFIHLIRLLYCVGRDRVVILNER
jgi:hypothetical protein